MKAKNEQKRGLWTAEEDRILMDYIRVHGNGKWNRIARETGLKRCGRSCRLRWMNYLSPNVKRGDFSEEEEDLIIRLHKLLGNRWSLIAGRVPGRTDNQVKNHWNSHLSKKLGMKQGKSKVTKTNNKNNNNNNSQSISRGLEQNSDTPSGLNLSECSNKCTNNIGEAVGDKVSAKECGSNDQSARGEVTISENYYYEESSFWDFSSSDYCLDNPFLVETLENPFLDFARDIGLF